MCDAAPKRGDRDASAALRSSGVLMLGRTTSRSSSSSRTLDEHHRVAAWSRIGDISAPVIWPNWILPAINERREQCCQA